MSLLWGEEPEEPFEEDEDEEEVEWDEVLFDTEDEDGEEEA